jgi:hypothetical protein
MTETIKQIAPRANTAKGAPMYPPATNKKDKDKGTIGIGQNHRWFLTFGF